MHAFNGLVAALLGLVAFGAQARAADFPSFARDLGPTQSGIYYEIFVRSFQDSNGDGVGDLDGITSRLDYLSALGIDGIWLTPIFPSPSYHGYDATDYYSVAAEYGGLPALQRLLHEAHRRGIQVLLDIAVNHTSDRHPWFMNSRSSPTSPMRDRYLWRDHNPGWNGPGRWWADEGGSYYYSTFSEDMPDLNWRDPATLAEVKRILGFWKAEGVDGFRLDAARYYVKGPEGESDTAETHAAIADFTQAIRSEYPGTFFVGEIWADWNTIVPYIATGDELDSAFGFPLSDGIVSALRLGHPTGLKTALADLAGDETLADRISPFLTNHDMDRVASQLDSVQPMNIPGLKLAAATLLTLPGTPFLYYGEEIGMTNGQGSSFAGDLAKRTPMQWDASENHGFTSPGAEPWLGFSSDSPALTVASQEQDASSLWQAYRQLIAIRHASTALRDGALVPLPSAQNPSLVAFARVSDSETVIFAGNFSGQSIPAITVSLPGELPSTAGWHTLWSPPGVRKRIRTRAAGLPLPPLPAWAAVVLSSTRSTGPEGP